MSIERKPTRLQSRQWSCSSMKSALAALDAQQLLESLPDDPLEIASLLQDILLYFVHSNKQHHVYCCRACFAVCCDYTCTGVANNYMSTLEIYIYIYININIGFKSVGYIYIYKDMLLH